MKNKDTGLAFVAGILLGAFVTLCVVLMNPTYQEGKEEVRQEAVRAGVAHFDSNKKFKWKTDDIAIELQEIE